MKNLKVKLTAGLFAILSLVAFSNNASAVQDTLCQNNTAPTSVTCPTGIDTQCCFILVDGVRQNFLRAE